MARPPDKTCLDCNAYDSVDSETGKCKKERVERHMDTHSSGVESNTDIINGSPVVKGLESACGDYEIKVPPE